MDNTTTTTLTHRFCSVLLWDGFDVHGFLQNAGIHYPSHRGLTACRMLCKRIRKVARKSGVLAEYDGARLDFVRQEYDRVGSSKHRRFMEAKSRFDQSVKALRAAVRGAQ